MQAIVETLTALNGVRHVGIYKNGEVLGSNFTDELEQAMLNSSEVISQLFLALESVEKTHNEIFIGVDSGYLAGFWLYAGHVAVLLTEKKINFPMISMGIKSAAERLKQELEEAQQKFEQQQTALAAANDVSESSEPTNEELIPFINQYVYILTEFLGPAASVVVEDAVTEWKGTYVQSPNNLTYLVTLLLKELDTVNEKQLFKAKADRVILTDM
jgi:hypothetical protein